MGLIIHPDFDRIFGFRVDYQATGFSLGLSDFPFGLVDFPFGLSDFTFGLLNFHLDYWIFHGFRLVPRPFGISRY